MIREKRQSATTENPSISVKNGRLNWRREIPITIRISLWIAAITH